MESFTPVITESKSVDDPTMQTWVITTLRKGEVIKEVFEIPIGNMIVQGGVARHRALYPFECTYAPYNYQTYLDHVRARNEKEKYKNQVHIDEFYANEINWK